jgi:hypothetical protein
MSSYTRQRTVSALELADAFVRGQGATVRTSSALSCTAETVYSYAEPIATFDRERQGTILLTSARFSVTTSKHIGQIRRAAESNGVPLEIVDHETVKRARYSY